MTQGVILAAFGKPNYIYMAAHLAASLISENKDLKITLLHDEAVGYMPKDFYQFFDKLIHLKREDLFFNGRKDPGFVKINIPKYLPYDETLYLDVDGLCLQDVSPLFSTEKDFATEVVGQGGINDEINYLFWTTKENAWKYFGLKKNSVYRSVQSSSMFFRKGETVEKLHKEWVKAWDFPSNFLLNQWGGTTPDELIISGVCAKLDYDPAFGRSVVFFGYKNRKHSFKEMTEQFFILAIYGGKGLVKPKYLDFYDRRAIRRLATVGVNTISGASALLRKKHATGWT